MQIDRRPSIFNFLLVALLLAVLGGGERAAAEKCAAGQRAWADINHNNIVDGEDMAILLTEWGNTNFPPADINHDGVVDGPDLTLVLASWGPCDVSAHTKSKIMFIRHAEKPGCYTPAGLSVSPDLCYYKDGNPFLPAHYNGVNSRGMDDDKSLVTLGWERAGGIAQLFSSLAGTVNGNSGDYHDLAVPNHIFAADPEGTTADPDPSKRPNQTVQALSYKLGLTINTHFSFDEYQPVVEEAYNLACAHSTNILISWQHELILTSSATEEDKTVGMAQYLCWLTNQNPHALGLPLDPWPGVPGVGQGDRYDMVLVFDLVNGRITQFTQVPQMLLAVDKPDLFP